MTCTALALALVTFAMVAYRAAFVDAQGHLHLTVATGSDVVVQARAQQVTFEQPRVSSDHRTVGWLETYRDPGSSASATPLADTLVVYRGGRIVRIIATPQIFWSWRFADDGADVVACTGPTHGGATDCAVHRIATGAVTSHRSPSASDP